MAMKPCRECGISISTEAKTCPHCGASRPAGGTSVSGGFCGCLALGIAGIIVAGTCSAVVNAPRLRAEDARCREMGIAFYRDMGSYPNLSTGERAEAAVKRMCDRSSWAFGNPTQAAPAPAP